MSASLDGELSRWERAMLRLHLLLCAPCRRVQRSLGKTVEALHAMRPEAPRNGTTR